MPRIHNEGCVFARDAPPCAPSIGQPPAEQNALLLPPSVVDPPARNALSLPNLVVATGIYPHAPATIARDTIISWESSSKTRIFLAELLSFAEPEWPSKRSSTTWRA